MPQPTLPSWWPYVRVPVEIVASAAAVGALARWVFRDKIVNGMAAALGVPAIVAQQASQTLAHALLRTEHDQTRGMVTALDGKLANAIDRLARSVEGIDEKMTTNQLDLTYLRGRFDQEYDGTERRAGDRRGSGEAG